MANAISIDNLQDALTQFKTKINSSIYVDPMDVKDSHITEYADLYMSGSQIVPQGSAKTKIKFNALRNANIPVNLTNYSIHLTKGKSYRIYASLALNTSSRLSYYICDASNLNYVSSDAMVISANYNEVYTNSPMDFIYFATADIDICVVVGSATVATDLLISFCRFNVQEIAQPVVVEYNNYKEISKFDVLFDGVANVLATDYTLQYPVTNYKYIIVHGGVANGDTITNSTLINVNDIIYGSANQVSLGYYQSPTNNWGIVCGFKSASVFNIDSMVIMGWSNQAISKVVGVY